MKATRKRQIFVLTSEEKKVIACIVGALLLGVVTQHYRHTHPTPPTPPTAQEQRTARIAHRAAAAKTRAARIAEAARATPAPSLQDDEEE